MKLFICSMYIRQLSEISGLQKFIRGIFNTSECRYNYSEAISFNTIFDATLHYCQIFNLLAGALIISLGLYGIFCTLQRKNIYRIVALKRSRNRFHQLQYSWTIFLIFTLSGFILMALTTLHPTSGLVEILQSSIMLTITAGIFAYGCRIVNHRNWSLKIEENSSPSLLHKINYTFFPRSRLAIFSFILGMTFCRSLIR